MVSLVAVDAMAGGADLTPPQERGLPSRGHRINALTWLLRYNRHGLLGYLW